MLDAAVPKAAPRHSPTGAPDGHFLTKQQYLTSIVDEKEVQHTVDKVSGDVQDHRRFHIAKASHRRGKHHSQDGKRQAHQIDTHILLCQRDHFRLTTHPDGNVRSDDLCEDTRNNPHKETGEYGRPHDIPCALQVVGSGFLGHLHRKTNAHGTENTTDEPYTGGVVPTAAVASLPTHRTIAVST